LSKRLARDRLQAADILPYREEDEIEAGASEAIEQAYRDIQLDSLDLVNLGPYVLIAEVKTHAEAMLRQAQEEAEMLRERARGEGAAQGREEAKQEALPSIMAFANAGQTLIVFEEQMIGRYEPEIVRLALEIAEKIVQRSVVAEPDIVASVLERARREVSDAHRIRIHLNPADQELLEELRPDLLMIGHDHGRVIEVIPDEEVSRGGSRLVTEIGVVDATLPTQIDEIRRQLLDEDGSQKPTISSQTPGGGAVRREL
jgi:flagellar biosynthesis/type III secretory pathway protein FliH